MSKAKQEQSVKGWDFHCAHALPEPRATQETLDLAFRMEAKRNREAVAMERAATEAQLLAELKASLLILRTLYNVPISDQQIEERSNNFITNLTGNYRVERLP